MIATKPQYRIPLMSEIQQIPLNGYKVVSTFSGCGGSCLGFRWAGFEPVWASEFVEHAAQTYLANHSGVMLDRRDIRDVTADDIAAYAGKDIDVLEGSPPCAAFSVSGKREKFWGQVRTYSETEQRVDDLFFEYARLLKDLQPKVFVAENVPGLVKGVAKGYFLMILRELKKCGYRVTARLLDSQWLGVPQSRQRLFFVGVREDLGIDPPSVKPLDYRYNLHDAFQDLPAHEIPEEAQFELHRAAYLREWRKLRQGEGSEKFFNLIRVDPQKPCPTIHAASTRAASPSHWHEPRFFTIPELKRICGFPDDFRLEGRFDKQGERLGRAVPPPVMYRVALSLREVLDAAASRSA